MKFSFVLFSVIVFSILISNSSFQYSFSQEELSIHQQWKIFGDPNMLFCPQELILLQKIDGTPVCVKPTTYLALVEREYGYHDLSFLSNHYPKMMNNLMTTIVSNEQLMNHWHEMLKKDNSIMMQAMDNWVFQIKQNPNLLKNLLGPMASDLQLRDQMIHTMRNHPTMEFHLKQNSIWMESIHGPVVDGFPEHKNFSNLHCSWCPHFSSQSVEKFTFEGQNSDKSMEILHEIWINAGMREDLHEKMLQNPSHLSQMAQKLMKPMLYPIMDEPNLRLDMINLLLEHNEFMNSIRHANSPH